MNKKVNTIKKTLILSILMAGVFLSVPAMDTAQADSIVNGKNIEVQNIQQEIKELKNTQRIIESIQDVKQELGDDIETGIKEVKEELGDDIKTSTAAVKSDITNVEKQLSGDIDIIYWLLGVMLAVGSVGISLMFSIWGGMKKYTTRVDWIERAFDKTLFRNYQPDPKKEAGSTRAEKKSITH